MSDKNIHSLNLRPRLQTQPTSSPDVQSQSLSCFQLTICCKFSKRCSAAHIPLHPRQHQSFIHTHLQQNRVNKTAPFGIAVPGMWVKLLSRFSSIDVGVLSKRWQIWWAGLQLRLSLQSLSIQTWSGPARANVSVILTYMVSGSGEASVAK